MKLDLLEAKPLTTVPTHLILPHIHARFRPVSPTNRLRQFGAHSPASPNQIKGYPSSPADNVTSHLTRSSNGRIPK